MGMFMSGICEIFIMVGVWALTLGIKESRKDRIKLKECTCESDKAILKSRSCRNLKVGVMLFTSLVGIGVLGVYFFTFVIGW
jgi:hypothetical protein